MHIYVDMSMYFSSMVSLGDADFKERGRKNSLHARPTTKYSFLETCIFRRNFKHVSEFGHSVFPTGFNTIPGLAHVRKNGLYSAYFPAEHVYNSEALREYFLFEMQIAFKAHVTS